MLCSFAHFGANQYQNHQVGQEQVVKLSKERGVNHTLIDAQVRLELTPKKYTAQHQAYLDAVTTGQTIKRPVVYEPPPSQKKEREQENSKEQAGDTAAAPRPIKTKQPAATTKRAAKTVVQKQPVRKAA